MSNAGWDINMLRWLEREGFDVGYCTNLDAHSRPWLLSRCKAWLSIGHDEYWSVGNAPARRGGARRWRQPGLLLGQQRVLAGAPWRPSAASGTADRVMVCHKKAARDPLAQGAHRSRTTTSGAAPPSIALKNNSSA